MMTLLVTLNSARQLSHVVSTIDRSLIQSKSILGRPLHERSIVFSGGCPRCCWSVRSFHVCPTTRTIEYNHTRPQLDPKSYKNLIYIYPSHVIRYDQRILSTSYLEQSLYHRRLFHSSQILYDKEPSSKVEQTVNALKEEALKRDDKSTSTAPTEAKTSDQVKSVSVAEVPKRSLAKRAWDEVVHYYHGFRLLFIDIRIASRLLLKSMRGNDLSRREYRQLTRTTADIFRLLPFSIFIIVPFMELLLPIFLKFFPGMLPSTFQSAKDKVSYREKFCAIDHLILSFTGDQNYSTIEGQIGYDKISANYFGRVST